MTDEEKKEEDKEEGADGEVAAEEAQPEEEVAAEDAGPLLDMPDGEYQLHVLIEQGKSIVLEGEDLVNPLMVVKWCGKEKKSSSKKNVAVTTVAKWDEHVFIDSGKVEKEFIEDSKIELQILNYGFFKAETIGYYSISTAKLYKMNSKVDKSHKHVFHNQNISFTNPDGLDKAKITATFALSMTVQGPGDEAVQLKIGTDPDAPKYKPWMPASVQKKYKQLCMRFIKAEFLPQMDSDPVSVRTGHFGDAYIFIKTPGGKLRTSTIDMNQDGSKRTSKPVHWNEEFMLPIELPISNDDLQFLLYDSDYPSIDEIICGINFSLKQLIKESDQSKAVPDKDGNIKIKPKMKYVSLYGCGKDYVGVLSNLKRSYKNMCLQDQNNDAAAHFQGRLLVEYYTIDSKAPIMKMRKINQDDDFKGRLALMTKEYDYQIFAEIRTGMCLPQKIDYKIRICVGELEWTSDWPIQGKNEKMFGYNRWNYRVCESFKAVYEALDQFPTVFIYLLEEKKSMVFGNTFMPICYWKGRPEDFDDPVAKPMWVSLIPDLAVGYCRKPHLAGMIQFRLHFHACQKRRDGILKEIGPIDKKTIFPRDFPRRTNAFRMRAYIYQAESLPPADKSGTSDPYVSIWTPAEQKLRTQVVEQTNNPIFYETVDFILEYNDNDDAPPIVINVYDSDPDFFLGVGKGDPTEKDDYIGRATIFMDQIGLIDDITTLLQLDDTIPKPTWYPIKYSMDAPHSDENGARILVALAKIQFDENYSVEAEKIELDQVRKYEVPGHSIPITLDMPDLAIRCMNVDINVLGLRDLISPGLCPIKKAYCKFSVKSLLPPAQSKAVADIFTEPDQGGPDPNVQTTLKIQVNIPSQPFYCPRMTCMAYDKLYLDGMSQPIIGSFTLKLGEILAKVRYNDQKTLEDSKNMVQMISTVIKGKLGRDSDKTVLDILNKQQAIFKKRKALSTNVGQTQMAQTQVAADTDEGSHSHSGRCEDVLHGDDADHSDMDEAEKEVYQKKLKLKRKQSMARQKYLKDQEEKEAKELAEREEAEEALQKKSREGASNHIIPKYKYDQRLDIDKEVDIPPANLFMEIGYNKNKDDNKKRYIRYYTKELENLPEVMPASPFHSEPMYRMQKKGTIFGLGGSKDSEDNELFVTGKFKGLIMVYSKELREEREVKIDKSVSELKDLLKRVYEIQMRPKKFLFEFKDLEGENRGDAFKTLQSLCKECGIGALKVDEFIQNYKFEKELLHRLTESVKGIATLYILEGYNFASRDMFSLADPYLIIKCGKDKFDERKAYQEDTAEPVFYKCYQFNVSFPGSPVLSIEAWDYDGFFGDSLIGVTKLDFDDRFYNKQWSGIENKPIEYRNLYHHTTAISQGVIKMWCEIDKKDSKKAGDEPMDITPEPIREFEMRLIIWKTKDIEMMDFEGTSDVYVRSFMNLEDDHLTDTHWRCQTGEASFNWRNLIKIKTKQPKDDYKITIQAMDKDIFSSDELIGEFSFDFWPLFEDAYYTDKLQTFCKQYWDTHMKNELIKRNYADVDEIKFDSKDDKEEKFWIPMRRMDQETNELMNSGYVQCSFRVYSKDAAEKNEQGKGQEKPNSDPFLPPPEGRISLTLNPFTMFTQLIGPGVRKKIYLACCLSACLALCTMMGPMIFSNLVSTILTSWMK